MLVIYQELKLKLRKVFGPQWKHVIGGWRRLYGEEPHNLYSSPYIVSVIKCSTMRWARYTVCMGRREMHLAFWWGNIKEGDTLKDLGVDGKIILKFT
jgi:hypothetical protein